MAHHTHAKITDKHYVDDDGYEVTERRDESRARTSGYEGRRIISNIIKILYGILSGLLIIRLFLTLFGANRSNGFADFIYSSTGPYVAPFRSLFNIDTTIGNGLSRFEIETMFALIIYALVYWVVIRLINVDREDEIT